MINSQINQQQIIIQKNQQQLKNRISYQSVRTENNQLQESYLQKKQPQLLSQYRSSCQDYDGPPPNKYYYIQLIGEQKTGKSSIVNRFVNNHFTKEYKKTQDLVQQKYQCTDFHNQYQQNLYIQFIDTNGDLNNLQQAQRYADLPTTIIFVYDHHSIKNAKEYFQQNWLKFVQKMKIQNKNENQNKNLWKRVILCRNKCKTKLTQDLKDKQTKFQKQMKEKLKKLQIQVEIFNINCDDKNDDGFKKFKKFIIQKAINQSSENDFQSQMQRRQSMILIQAEQKKINDKKQNNKLSFNKSIQDINIDQKRRRSTQNNPENANVQYAKKSQQINKIKVQTDALKQYQSDVKDKTLNHYQSNKIKQESFQQPLAQNKQQKSKSKINTTVETNKKQKQIKVQKQPTCPCEIF